MLYETLAILITWCFSNLILRYCKSTAQQYQCNRYHMWLAELDIEAIKVNCTAMSIYYRLSVYTYVYTYTHIYIYIYIYIHIYKRITLHKIRCIIDVLMKINLTIKNNLSLIKRRNYATFYLLIKLTNYERMNI